MLSATKIGNIPGCGKCVDHLRSYREFTRGEHTPEMRRRVGNKKPRLLNLGYHWGQIVRVKGVFIQSAAPNL